MEVGRRGWVLTAGNMTGPEMAKVFLQSLRLIVRLATTHPAPFVAGVSVSGVRVYKLQ